MSFTLCGRLSHAKWYLSREPGGGSPQAAGWIPFGAGAAIFREETKIFASVGTLRFPSGMTFREFNPNTKEYEQALQLREAVLRVPLGLVLTEGELADEPNCRHLGGFDAERLVAVLLLRPLDDQTVKMRQVAVHPEFQKLAMGSRLVAFAERFAKERGFTRMVAHARGTAVEFYRKAGYATVGEDFIEQTIPHRLVTKEL